MVIEYYKRKQFLAITTFKIKLFDPDCIEIGLIVNVAPGAPGSGERRKEICLIQTGQRVALFSEFVVWLQANVIKFRCLLEQSAALCTIIKKLDVQ